MSFFYELSVIVYELSVDFYELLHHFYELLHLVVPLTRGHSGLAREDAGEDCR